MLDLSDQWLSTVLRSQGYGTLLYNHSRSCLRQAKGELRAAQTEIRTLKEDKVVLGQALESKAKEVRAQLLQVCIRIRSAYSDASR